MWIKGKKYRFAIVFLSGFYKSFENDPMTDMHTVKSTSGGHGKIERSKFINVLVNFQADLFLSNIRKMDLVLN